MLAKQNDFINEASATVYQLSQEEQIRLQCQAREDYYRRQRAVQYNMDKQKETIESQNTTIESQNITIKNQNIAIKSQNITIKQLTEKVAFQEEKITSQQQELIVLWDEIASLKKLLALSSEKEKCSHLEATDTPASGNLT